MTLRQNKTKLGFKTETPNCKKKENLPNIMVSTKFGFQFTPLTNTLQVSVDSSLPVTNTKTVVYAVFFEKPRILKEVLKQISTFLEECGSEIDEEKQVFLNSLQKNVSDKISLFEKEENGEENLQEFDFDDKQINFFINSMQFSCSGHTFSVEEEEKSINDHGIQKTQIIQIIFNIKLGFQERIPSPASSNNSDSDKPSFVDQQVNPFFICMEHSKETTHYCETCKKLVHFFFDKNSFLTIF